MFLVERKVIVLCPGPLDKKSVELPSFGAFRADDEFACQDDYLIHMARYGTYGDQITLCEVANLYNIDIQIVSSLGVRGQHAFSPLASVSAATVYTLDILLRTMANAMERSLGVWKQDQSASSVRKRRRIETNDNHSPSVVAMRRPLFASFRGQWRRIMINKEQCITLWQVTSLSHWISQI
ncbi:hypothetical protein AWC38_SpisGene11098 [Stylophora pistillata]|uniref:Uncharacterized protein n=1 Tax=Stylophora pistillata TaxID=50429 RepID=A0A2B4S5I4_STYPI|nr:hypothetical protein AWC38_SpisGene11098 [Stylophora pistillata]